MNGITIPLSIMVDKSYAEKDNLWKNEISDMIENIADIFQREFQINISFQIDNLSEWIAPSISSIEDWLGEAYKLHENIKIPSIKERLKKDLHRLWSLEKLTLIVKMAESIAKNIDKITIILISDPEVPQIPPGITLLKSKNKNLSTISLEMEEWTFPDEHFASIPECYILIRMSSDNPTNVLIHEIAAIFGAKHPQLWGEEYVKRHNSVMNPEQVFESDSFDPKNHAIVSKNINILFKSMASPER